MVLLIFTLMVLIIKKMLLCVTRKACRGFNNPSQKLSASRTYFKHGYDDKFYEDYKSLKNHNKAINVTATVNLEEYLKLKIELESANRLISKCSDACYQAECAVHASIKQFNEHFNDLCKSENVPKSREMKKFTLLVDKLSTEYSCIAKKIYYMNRKYDSEEKLWEIKKLKSIDNSLNRDQAIGSFEENVDYCNREISKLDNQINIKSNEVSRKLDEL